ncbi:hypothetical protein [Brevibacterium zhoupengii]|uniref:hypothetical protein n=1 Tax=Brevibacterium zhoupengii TaxID=2898795 RepID=UPI001E32DFD5|nr:hypothetical protein [Brevibacterium zhoupengii]
MYWPLTPREHEVALTMIRHAHPSSAEEASATYADAQQETWDSSAQVTPAQRVTWESNLAEVVVTNPCDCGSCPSIGMRPVTRVDDESRDDTGGQGDFANRVILDATVDGCMLLLFIDDDSPSYLELAPTDDEVFTEFPPPERILF